MSRFTKAFQSAGVAEPVSDRSYDFVDLGWFQESWFFFQFPTPTLQFYSRPSWLVTAFIGDILDGCFPFCMERMNPLCPSLTLMKNR
jgi:hypothetical protein